MTPGLSLTRRAEAFAQCELNETNSTKMALRGMIAQIGDGDVFHLAQCGFCVDALTAVRHSIAVSIPSATPAT